MASGIEIRELPSVPVTAESLTVIQNPDGTGSATLASVREHVGVSIDEVTVSAEVVEAGNDPDASVEVTGTDQHKDILFGFTLPRATKTVFTAEGEATEAGTDPAVQMTEGGTPSDRKYALKFSLPKATKTQFEVTGEAAEAGTDPAVQMTEGGTPSDRKYGVKFTLPRATRIAGVSVSATGLPAGESPKAEVTEGGTATEREYAFSFSIPQGLKGDKGDPFAVKKTFPSVEEMNAGFETDGVLEGEFVVIDTGNVEDADNAKLYVKGKTAYSYITDLSGAQGIKGDAGEIESFNVTAKTGETGTPAAAVITQGGTPSKRQYTLSLTLPRGEKGEAGLTAAEVSLYAHPVGSIYVQFAGQATPDTLYGGTWQNISSSFAGLFFRAEGGAAAPFGSSQGGGVPNITGTCQITGGDLRDGLIIGSGVFSGSYNLKINNTRAGYSSPGGININFNAGSSNGLYGAANEIRPVNSTIRIWKRTA